MRTSIAYFALGFVAASVLWLLVFLFLNHELLRTFSSFSGQS